jgi:hypothetical protein
MERHHGRSFQSLGDRSHLQHQSRLQHLLRKIITCQDTLFRSRVQLNVEIAEQHVEHHDYIGTSKRLPDAVPRALGESNQVFIEALGILAEPALGLEAACV